jgi:glycosyltransferase involved in cell wall biosynthesis
LKSEPVEITVAGPIQINQAVVDAAPKNMRWLGAIPRSQTKEIYQSHDVFVLPTLSDGFAITQIEAMAYGLPVVATPNCGLVVKEGSTGHIVPPRNAEALADAIADFIRHPSLVAQMSAQCLEAVKDYSVETYGRALQNIIQSHLKPNHP